MTYPPAAHRPLHLTSLLLFGLFRLAYCYLDKMSSDRNINQTWMMTQSRKTTHLMLISLL